jgi:hypothetical protein
LSQGQIKTWQSNARKWPNKTEKCDRVLAHAQHRALKNEERQGLGFLNLKQHFKKGM